MEDLPKLGDDQIHVVNSFSKEVESLERTFQQMLQTLQEGRSDSPQATLQHMLLLDHGVDQAKVRLGDLFSMGSDLAMQSSC